MTGTGIELIKTAQWLAQQSGVPHLVIKLNGRLVIRAGVCPEGALLIERCLP